MRSPLIKHLTMWGATLVVALVAITVFIRGLSVQVCRDWAFICENTGSQKGYRQWCLGLRSASWYRESRLELFMRKEHPAELANRWTSYAGTGKNVLGRPILFGHGDPGPILHVPAEFLDRYVDGLDSQAKLDLYQVLAAGPPEKVESEMAKIWDRAIAEVWEMQRGTPKPQMRWVAGSDTPCRLWYHAHATRSCPDAGRDRSVPNVEVQHGQPGAG